MKEMPGLPELPEGWFFRITSMPYAQGHRTYRVWLYRPVWVFNVPVKVRKVTDHHGFGFHRPNEANLSSDILKAANAIYGVSANVIEGDYR